MIRKLFVAGCLLVASVAQAGSAGGGLGGGEVPTPFLSSNQKVELADGELYTLVGFVRFWNGAPYLEVDLVQHPWLSNAHRKAEPYYALEGSAQYWRRFENVRLKAYVEAHSTVEVVGGTPRHALTLNPLADPEVLQMQVPRSRPPKKKQR